MTPSASLTVLAALLLLAGCTGLGPNATTGTPPPPPPPTSPDSLIFEYPSGFIPDDPIPTVGASFSRIYVEGFGKEGDGVLALDPKAMTVQHGVTANDAFTIGAALHDGLGVIFFIAGLQSNTVGVVTERDLSFTPPTTSYSPYEVTSVAVLHDTTYAMLADQLGVLPDRLVKWDGSKLVEVPLDPAWQYSNTPTIGSNGEVLGLCYNGFPEGVMQAVLLDEAGKTLAMHLLDANTPGNNPCVVSTDSDALVFAWRNAFGETKLARLTPEAASPEIEVIGLNLAPEMVRVGGNATYVITHDRDAMPQLLVGANGKAWKECSPVKDTRDYVVLQQDGQSVWALSVPYTDGSRTLEGQRLRPDSCPELWLH